ncbi:hypothetical protein HZA43_04120 [Candidatus Peregrinibacteria bacterium]|nr:hypothetical protein [Candidatus Peregrinibacteria bacterium]
MASVPDQLIHSVGSPEAASPAAERDPRLIAVEAARLAATDAVFPVEVKPTPEERAAREALFFRISGAAINSDSARTQRGFVELCERHPEVQKTLEALQRHHPETYRHSVGVGLIMMALYNEHPELFADFTSEEQDDLARGAFMHDVGKLKGARMSEDDTVYDPAFYEALGVVGRRPTDAEMSLIKSHTSSEVVADRMNHVESGAFDRLGPLTQAVMIGHHSRYNREQAPGAEDPKVQKAMQLMELVDIFEAVTGVMGPRGYRLHEIQQKPAGFSAAWIDGVLNQTAQSDFQKAVVAVLHTTVRMDVVISAIHALASRMAQEAPFLNDAALYDGYAKALSEAAFRPAVQASPALAAA